nr:hypothetical protein [uncultured Azospirillum sp.]
MGGCREADGSQLRPLAGGKSETRLRAESSKKNKIFSLIFLSVLFVIAIVALYYYWMENTELQTATQQLLLEINRNHNHQAEATAERENLIDLRDRAEETAEEANRLLASVQSDLANLRATIVPKPAAHPGQVKAFENKSQEINLAVSSIAQQAGQLADTAKTAAQDPQPTPSGPTSSLPPRVYIQIPDGAREVARQLELRLEQRSVGGSKIIVPGIEVVPKPPRRPYSAASLLKNAPTTRRKSSTRSTAL